MYAVHKTACSLLPGGMVVCGLVGCAQLVYTSCTPQFSDIQRDIQQFPLALLFHVWVRSQPPVPRPPMNRKVQRGLLLALPGRMHFDPRAVCSYTPRHAAHCDGVTLKTGANMLAHLPHIVFLSGCVLYVFMLGCRPTHELLSSVLIMTLYDNKTTIDSASELVMEDSGGYSWNSLCSDLSRPD